MLADNRQNSSVGRAWDRKFRRLLIPRCSRGSFSDSDSLFAKFYKKESVSKAVSIQTQANDNTDIMDLYLDIGP